MTLALLCDNKRPSAACQQKFRTALTLNYFDGLNSFDSFKHSMNPISHGVFFDILAYGGGGVFRPPLFFSETTKDITMKLSSIVLWTISFPNITMVIN